MKTFEAGDEILKEGATTKEARRLFGDSMRYPWEKSGFLVVVGADPLQRRSTILVGCSTGKVCSVQ